MSRVYKTAKGKSIDIDKIKLANETVVAVGNMKVNARGDILGAGSQVAVGRNQVMDQVYAVNTGYSPNDPENFIEAVANESANAVNELSSLNVPDTTSADATVARGSLADSIANQKKSNGPSRI